MSGYPNSNTTGNQGAHPQTGAYTNTGTGAAPAQSDTAAQGGLLGMAQGWTNRVTTNLQGQTEQLKGKLGLQGTAGHGTATGQNTTGTRAGYEPTGTGTGYGSTTGSGAGYNPTGTGAGYSEYNTAGNQAGVPHGHNPTLNQGYASGQAGTGVGTAVVGANPGVGATGTAAQKPSYTDQAKDWTGRIVDNLHGQAEYLKTKVTGAPNTNTGTGTGVGYGQGTHTGQATGQFGQGQGQFGQGPTAGGPTGYNQDPAHRSTQAGVDPATGAQGKKSWTDSAKSWTATGLTYTQKGLEGIKNSVAGPSGTTTTGSAATTGTTGSSYGTGPATTGTGPAGSNDHTGVGTGTSGSSYNTGTTCSNYGTGIGTTGSSYGAGQPTTGANVDPNRKY